MDKAELIERLKGYEWNDVEFKEARQCRSEECVRNGLRLFRTPRAAGWSSVSGTVPVDTRVVGVLAVDKVQNDFLSVLRAGQKLNRVIAVDERLIEDDGKVLLVFHIPEAHAGRTSRFTWAAISGKSYIRRGAGDERCTEARNRAIAARRGGRAL